jgi:DNA-binding PadR family transcriptional regulator
MGDLPALFGRYQQHALHRQVASTPCACLGDHRFYRLPKRCNNTVVPQPWWAIDRFSITRYDTTLSDIDMSDATLLVLASLSDGDKHGYAMMEDIERFAGLRLGPGTLYGAITRLEERGWIKPVEADDRRRPYMLTTSGREYLKGQVDALDRVLKTAARRLKHA